MRFRSALLATLILTGLAHGQFLPPQVKDTPYGASWNGVRFFAPSQNAVYDKIEAILVGALDPILNDIIVQNPVANEMLYWTGAGTSATILSTAFGRGILVDADTIGFYNVKKHGALGNGVANDTAAIAAALAAINAAGGGTLYVPKGTFLTDPIDASAIANLRIVGAGEAAILQRRSWGTAVAFLKVGTLAIVRDVTLNGNQAGGAPADGDYGLQLSGDDCLVERVYSYEHYDHGIRIDGDRCRVLYCRSLDNGANPGAAGTGDGIYIRDPYDEALILGCYVSGNARNGITVTKNVADMYRNQVIACTTSGTNGYIEIDGEGSTDTLIEACAVKGQILASSSTRAKIAGNTVINGTTQDAQIYLNGGNYATIRANKIVTDDLNQRIYVNGNTPNVVDNEVIYTGAPPSGYAIELANTNAANTTIVTGNRVDHGYRGIYATAVGECWGNVFDTMGNAANIVRVASVGGRDVTYTGHVTAGVEIRNGRALAWSTAAPTAGTWEAGDRVFNSGAGAGESPDWICITAGTPGTWLGQMGDDKITVTIADDGTWDSEATPIWQAPMDYGVTITEVRATVMGSTVPSLTYNVEERAWGSLDAAGTDIYAADQAADATGEQELSFSNASIAAAAYLVFTTGAGSETGTVNTITLTICYRRVW